MFVDLGAPTAVQIILADASLGLREESSQNMVGVALRLGGGGGGGGAEVLLLYWSPLLAYLHWGH